MRSPAPTSFGLALSAALALFAALPAASAQALADEAPAPEDSVSSTRAHALQPRGRREAGRHEVTLYPFTAQLNDTWSRHFGLSLGYTWHVTERLALNLTPFFNYVSGESSFQRELIDKASVQADAATALLLHWGATAGVELSPIDGKFAFCESVLGHFSLSLSLGLGGASTRVQLSDDGFGSSGGRFIGSVGLALRLAVNERWALRLEVKDIITTARVSRIEGCTKDDFAALSRGEAVSTSCGADGLSEVERTNAALLLESESSSILNQVSFLLGVSFLF